MAWQECVDYVKTIYNPLKEAMNVDWSTVNKNDLDNDNFKKGTPFYLVCPDRHCTDNIDISPAAHQYCQCKDINGNQIPNCTPKQALEPIQASVCMNVKTKQYNGFSSRACINQGSDWYQLTCFCCCSCFANGTLIAIPGPAGVKKIEDFQANIDSVSTAKIDTSSSEIKLIWESSRVCFSQGTGPDGHQSNMISLTYDNPEFKDGTYKSIICTPDQLFLLSTGKLKRADQLSPSEHMLVNKNGEKVAIHEVAHGEYIGGVHHIATDRKFTSELNNHLILSEGVVSGDFTLQINTDNIHSYLCDDHYTAPKVGSVEYIANNTNLKKVNYAKFQIPDFDNAKVQELKANFFASAEHLISIPFNAAKYISSAQEEDIYDKLDLIHFTELSGRTSILQYLIKLYRGFFPDIKIYFSSGMTEANAYAFENQYKEKTIVISGGLARIKNLNLEGFSLIIAHMISCVQKSAPLNYQGYTSVGMADYYSTQILATVFYNEAYNNVVNKGISQITEAIFNNISSKNINYNSDPYKPNVDTRLDAFDAGYSMNFPPNGIGGPEFQGLDLNSVSSTPAVFNKDFFITEDIDEVTSHQTYDELVKHSVLLPNGILSKDFNINTNLSFLFNEKDVALKTLLTEEVRYKLLYPIYIVTVVFNKEMSSDRISVLDDFEFTQNIKVKSSSLDMLDSTKVHLGIIGIESNVEYKLTVSTQLTSANGSTLNPEKNSASFLG
jgi:hypothetical protein